MPCNVFLQRKSCATDKSLKLRLPSLVPCMLVHMDSGAENREGWHMPINGEITKSSVCIALSAVVLR